MNKEIWLWLLLVMQPHNENTLKIVEEYGDVRKAAEAIRDGECKAVNAEEHERAKKIRNREVSELIELCRANNIRIITIEDEEYPALMKETYNAPIVLFVKGDIFYLNTTVTLAVVGTRNPSAYGIYAANEICPKLSELGMVLVSGLAVGLDTVAHRAALQNKAPTVGVLACGHLVDYPAASHQLKEEILQKGGAIISELPPKTSVTSDYFKHRNRIISGIANGTFIVEAPERSGCLLTAEHTIQQGRELFCLPPHDVFSPAFSGVIPYLRDGATPVFGYVDIVNTFKYTLFRDYNVEEQ